MEYISYRGWIGNNNLGDEAIYNACQNLFSEYKIISKSQIPDRISTSLELFGGGTIWPPSEVSNEKVSAGIGVGVNSPEYRNRKWSKIDLGYYLGRAGLDEILDKPSISWGLKPIDYIFDSVTIKKHYISEDQFQRLAKVDHIGVRGPISKQILSNYGIDSVITGDTALLLEPSEYNKSNTIDKMAISLRETSEFSHKWTESTEYIDIIKRFCENKEAQIEFIFIPLKPSDISLHIELASNIKNSRFENYCSQSNVGGVLEEYTECDLIISERLHGNVLGACTHTPFISLEYRPKNLDFAKSIGMSDYNIRIDNLSYEWLEKAFQTLESNDIENELEKEVEIKRKKIARFSNKISERLSLTDSY